MKGNSLFKRAYNNCLGLISKLSRGDRLPTQIELANALRVSRTTARAVLRELADAGIVGPRGRGTRLKRRPSKSDYFPLQQTESVSDVVERRFLEWILRRDARPGELINCAELARHFSTSTTAIRQHLSQFNHFGLLERRPNSAWVLKGITTEFAVEICEIREMFELRSAERFAELGADAPAWTALANIERDHRALLRNIDAHYRDFSQLDERFHRLIHDASNNRFVQNFFDVISMIFHYHYQWNKIDERQRNEAALYEHLAFIKALRSRDLRAIESKCRAHLQTARATLLRSIVPYEHVGPRSKAAHRRRRDRMQ